MYARDEGTAVTCATLFNDLVLLGNRPARTRVAQAPRRVQVLRGRVVLHRWLRGLQGRQFA
jgi:hypothetical protein